MVGVRRWFALADTVQQVVDDFLFTGSSIVTEEVWVLAQSMSFTQVFLMLIIVLTVGYGALYRTDDRDPGRECEVGGIPVRFISLISVPYLFVFTLASVFDTPGTSSSDVSGEVLVSVLGHGLDLTVPRITLEATSVDAVFSAINMVTADSLFRPHPAA